MPEFDPRKKAVEFLFVMNAAITNIRLYPPTSGIIVSSVDRMYKVLGESLSVVETLEYAESEKNLLVQGDPLPEKEQRKPQIASFLELMLDLGIKTIRIDRGITKDEISAFLQIAGRLPDEIDSAGGLQSLIKKFNIVHLRIDEKIYVGMDSEHNIMSGLNLRDEDFARFLVGEENVSDEVMAQVQEIAKNPNWFSSVFQQGVKQLLDETGNRKAADLSKTFAGMIETLDGITDFDKKEISKYIISSMSEMSDEVLASVLTQNLDTVFGDDFFSHFVEELDSEKFNRLFSRIRKMIERPDLEKFDASQIEAIERVYDLLKTTDAGQKALRSAEPKTEDKGEAGVDPVARLKKLKTALSGIMQGDTAVFQDSAVMDSLPDAVDQLLAKGKDAAVGGLMDKMGDALLNEDPEIRRAVAAVMSKIDEKFELTERLEERIELSRKLADWIKFETTVTPEYEKITAQLQNLSQTLIENDRAEAAEQILEAYHLIYSGNLKKDEAISALAGNMLQNLATDAILDLLLKDPKKNQDKKDDIYSLVILGTTTLERLLDRLRDSHNMSERNRIIQAISQIGNAAIPSIVERLRQESPWYAIRNLALLMGRVGDASHLTVLEPLLEFEDHRVQREAIKSIQTIGGEDAGRVLLNHLGSVDDQVKSYIVSVLGALQIQEAVPYLVDMLDDRSAVRNKAEREEVKEKICEALGRLKSQQAIPALEKIVRAKGLFNIRSHPEKVRTAAARALANIKRG